MLKLAFILALLTPFTSVFAIGGPDRDLNSITRQIYQRAGLSDNQVPFRHFEAAYHRYLQGRQSNQFNRPLISFVNFGTPSGEDRYFLVDVASSGGRILYSTLVSHGANS